MCQYWTKVGVARKAGLSYRGCGEAQSDKLEGIFQIFARERHMYILYIYLYNDARVFRKILLLLLLNYCSYSCTIIRRDEMRKREYDMDQSKLFKSAFISQFSSRIVVHSSKFFQAKLWIAFKMDVGKRS